jgi:hypothetical protein
MKHLQYTTETSETLETYLQHAISTNPGRRVGRRSTTQRDPALGRGGEGGWSRDAAEEVGLRTKTATESAQGLSCGSGRKEAW